MLHEPAHQSLSEQIAMVKAELRNEKGEKNTFTTPTQL